MKKNFLTLLTLVGASSLFVAQVGINTPSPTSTLDITAKNATGNSTNVDGIIIPRVDRLRAQSMKAIPTSTMIYVNSIATGSATGNAVNIDAVGYYYFNGTVWTKFKSTDDTDVNIYNSNGTVLSNRTVTQNDKTLTFTGTAANAFSVDGSTFSVDAANNRVGIGTTTPENRFHVVSATAIANRFNLFDAQESTAQHPILALRNTSPMATGNYSLLGFTNSGTTSGGANWGIGSIRTGNTITTGQEEEFFIGNSTGSTYYLERFRITSAGNVGIGTGTPLEKLHVNGGMQLTNEFNVGGNASTAGSPGTAGQVLKSAGPGAAPTWQNDFTPPTGVGSLLDNNGTLSVAQEVAVRMAGDWTLPNSRVNFATLTDELVDNKNTFAGTAVNNQFTIEATGTYTITMSFLVQAGTGGASGTLRYGIVNTGNGVWVGFGGDSIESLPAGHLKMINFTGVYNLTAGTAYSFSAERNSGDSSGTLIARGIESGYPASAFTIKRIK